MRRTRRERRGTAIVAALTLVALGAALLAASGAVATAGARAVLGERAAVIADAAARHAIALSLTRWDSRGDSLTVGAVRQAALPPEVLAAALPLPVSGSCSVQRLGRTLFALSADVRVGTSPWLARRRIRLFVERVAAADAAAPFAAVAPIGRWSTVDLY